MSKFEKIDTATAPAVPELRPAVFMPQITVGAFPILDETRDTLAAVIADRRMSRVTLGCEIGGLDTAIRKYAEELTPKLLLIEVEDSSETLMTKLDRLAALCPPETIVVLLGACNDVTLYRDLKRRGIAEYLLTPVTALGLINALGDVLNDESVDRRAPVTAFFGARGGCGTSTLAQNVAWELAHRCDTSVMLIDFDIASGTSALRLDLEGPGTVVTALDEGDRLDMAVLDRMLLRKGSRFALLPSPADLADVGDYQTADLRRVVDVARQTTSHVVLDLPSGWSRYVQGFLDLADTTMIVATPDLVSLRNCGKIVQGMRRARPNDAAPRLVLSQVAVPRSQQISPEKFAKCVGIPVHEQIAFDAAAFSKAENEGRPVSDSAPKSIAAKQIVSLTRSLSSQGAAKPWSGHRRLLPNLRGLFS